MIRRSLLAAAVIAASGLLGAVVPTQAREQPAMEVKEGKPAEAEFPGLVGSVPQSEEEVRPTPNDCKTYTWCDTVPLDIVVPAGLKEEDGFFVIVEVSWDDPAAANDIDTFLYDDGQKKGGAGYTQVGAGASSENPERAKVFRPDLGRYNLVVLNFSGANTGYKVKASLSMSKFESPYESLAPTTTAPANQTTDTTAPYESLEDEPTATTLAPVEAKADNDFAFEPSNFEDELAGAPDFGEFENAPLPAQGGRPVSKLAVVLSLVVAPLVLGAGLAAFMLRRRRSALGFG